MWGVVVRAVRLVFGLYLPVERARLIVAGLYHVNWINVIPGSLLFFPVPYLSLIFFISLVEKGWIPFR